MIRPGAGAVPILFVHYGEEWIRGSERCLLDLLKYLDRSRFQPVLWCNAETLADEARQLDVVVEVDRFTILLDWGQHKYDLRNYVRLVRRTRWLANRYGIRLIHANGVAPTQWTFPAARRLGLPLVTHMHAPYVTRDRFLMGLHQTTLAVGVTKDCVADLVADGFPESRTDTIHNGVDLSSWEGWEEKGLRARLGIASDDIVITQVGSLIHRKGHDLLMASVAELRRECPRCHLLIVGDGPRRKAIEEHAFRLGMTGAVHFLGFTRSPPGVIFRDATDIAVSPSRMEGFGLTVIEAGAAGCPVVATGTTGMTEIISNGTTGLIVPTGDGKSLTAALKRLVEDRSLRDRLGSALRDDVARRFLVQRYVADFHATYDRLLSLASEQLGWRGSLWPGHFEMYGRWAVGVATKRIGRILSRERTTPS